MGSELKCDKFKIVYEDVLNEHLMKYHMDLKISTNSLEQMQFILNSILKSLKTSNDYTVLKTNEYSVIYYKVGQIQ